MAYCTLVEHHILAEAGEKECLVCGEVPLDIGQVFEKAIAVPSPFKIGGQGRGGIVTRLAVAAGMRTRMERESIR